MRYLLTEMVGEVIAVMSPVLHPNEMQRVKLLAVETGGVWIESQSFTNGFLRYIGQSVAPRTLIFFLPYHQISFVRASLDLPSLSDTSLT
jgi:hypothetical protein